MFEFTKLFLIDTPTGRFVFVGKVPVVLKWERKDGRPMTTYDFSRAARSNAPALAGYQSCSWKTREEAMAEAEALGYEVAE